MLPNGRRTLGGTGSLPQLQATTSPTDREESRLNLTLMRVIDAQSLETPWYGGRQMAALLCAAFVGILQRLKGLRRSTRRGSVRMIVDSREPFPSSGIFGQGAPSDRLPNPSSLPTCPIRIESEFPTRSSR